MCIAKLPSSLHSRMELCHLPSCILDLDNACAGTNGDLCPTQESKLAVLWTVGIFALNFGPVFVGPILDWVGPKLTTTLGKPSPHMEKAEFVHCCCHTLA